MRLVGSSQAKGSSAQGADSLRVFHIYMHIIIYIIIQITNHVLAKPSRNFAGPPQQDGHVIHHISSLS